MFLALVCNAAASSQSPTSYVVPGWGSECFILMRPTFTNKKLSGIGICYQIKEDGKFENVWAIDGEYSFPGHLFLCENGSILVRIVEISQDKADSKKADLAQQTTLEFYRDGKLISTISAREVVDPSKLKAPVFSAALSTHEVFDCDEAMAPRIGTLSYFDYFDEEDKTEIYKITERGTQLFCVKTVQSEILVFKVSDGSLIYRKKLK